MRHTWMTVEAHEGIKHSIRWMNERLIDWTTLLTAATVVPGLQGCINRLEWMLLIMLCYWLLVICWNSVNCCNWLVIHCLCFPRCYSSKSACSTLSTHSLSPMLMTLNVFFIIKSVQVVKDHVVQYWILNPLWLHTISTTSVFMMTVINGNNLNR